MRGTVVVETAQEFKEWLAKQPAYYANVQKAATPAAEPALQEAPAPAAT